MSLKEKTVAAIVDATRPPDAPNAPIVHVVGEKEQRAILEKFKKDLHTAGIKAVFSPFNATKGLGFQVDLDVAHLLSETDMHYNWYYHNLELDFDRDVLQIRCGYNGTFRPIADVPHILRIVDAITTRLQVQWKRKQKRMKVHDLRIRAIELQVIALAKRLELSCRFERLHTKLWVCIFDNPWNDGVAAEIPLDEASHEHISKLQNETEEFHQRLEKRRARRRSARKVQIQK